MLPGVLLQGMTAVEIHWIAGNEGITVKECLERIQERKTAIKTQCRVVNFTIN